ncbi:ATPase, T2SS/T4P/T4SS family, partial [Stenotrophomonas maltophilia]|uniref:ATPase, T2SS/T4P/T4SS family n=1 Tax=Stenotrophomonas maltophilia TaxID=40324 RepID=UPI0013DBCF3C
ENRRPQDGKFSVEHGGKLVDVRVSTIPVEPAHEGITLRILAPDRITPDLNKLGISRIEQWRKGIKRKTGICLISGRTGSGKTTTLRASI